MHCGGFGVGNPAHRNRLLKFCDKLNYTRISLVLTHDLWENRSIDI